METFKHMERFNTQTHLIHNHSKTSEKRQGIRLLHTDHITYHCAEVSAPSPQRPAEGTYSSFLQGSHPWVPPPDHGGGELQVLWATGWISITNTEVAFQDVQLHS